LKYVYLLEALCSCVIIINNRNHKSWQRISCGNGKAICYATRPVLKNVVAVD
jgi:hypothetical protein